MTKSIAVPFRLIAPTNQALAERCKATFVGCLNESLNKGHKRLQYLVRCAGLPLAVYREVAAHLSQVDGVETELVSQSSQQFNYDQSQIGSLWIQCSEAVSAAGRSRVEQILAYYGDRYGAWEREVQAE